MDFSFLGEELLLIIVFIYPRWVCWPSNFYFLPLAYPSLEHVKNLWTANRALILIWLDLKKTGNVLSVSIAEPLSKWNITKSSLQRQHSSVIKDKMNHTWQWYEEVAGVEWDAGAPWTPIVPAKHAVALAKDGEEQSCRATGQRGQRGIWEMMGSVYRKCVREKETVQFLLRTNKRSLNTYTTVVMSLNL